MKESKKISVILLTAVMLIALTTACSTAAPSASSTLAAGAESASLSTTPSYADAFKDHMDISVSLWSIGSALANAGSDQFVQALEKKFNVTLKPVDVTWDDYSQKTQVWAASGQLPDIFSTDAIGTMYYRNWVKQGVIRALPRDLSKYPTLTQYLDKPDIQALKDNGIFYCVPRSKFSSLEYCAHDRNVFYRWDLAQKAGITQEPKTWDEFKTMLKAIITKDPEGKGIAGLTAVNVKHVGGFFWLYSDPAATSDGSGSDYKWIKDNGRYVPAVLDTKFALPSLKNARDMYEQGLIDKDIAQVRGQQAYDKFVSGTAAAILEVGYGNLNYQINERWKKLYPNKPLLDSVKRADYFPSTDGVSYYSAFKTYWSESYFSSFVDDKKMERIMSIYDWMLQSDTKEFYRYGVKGKDYTKDGDKINLITKVEDLNKKQPGAAVISSLVEFDDQYFYDDNNFSVDPVFRKAAVDNMKYARTVTKVPNYEVKLTYVSTPTKDKFSIFDYDFMLKIMMGEEPVEKMWDNVLKEYEAKGLSKMIREVNAKARELGLN